MHPPVAVVEVQAGSRAKVGCEVGQELGALGLEGPLVLIEGMTGAGAMPIQGVLASESVGEPEMGTDMGACSEPEAVTGAVPDV